MCAILSWSCSKARRWRQAEARPAAARSGVALWRGDCHGRPSKPLSKGWAICLPSGVAQICMPFPVLGRQGKTSLSCSAENHTAPPRRCREARGKSLRQASLAPGASSSPTSVCATALARSRSARPRYRMGCSKKRLTERAIVARKGHRENSYRWAKPVLTTVFAVTKESLVVA